VGLADSYALMAAYSVSPPSASMTRARAAALRALELDDSLAEAHASLGLVKLLHDWEWDEAERRFRRALALKPGLAIAHHWFSELLMARGRTAEALSELERAEELDPLSVILPTDRCRALYFARRYADALGSCRRALDADPAFVPALITQGMVLEETGRHAEALAAFREVARLSGDGPQQRTLVARATALAGDAAAARRMLEQIEEEGRSRYISPYSLALVHAALGDRDEAFRLLNAAVDERSSWMTYLAVNPRLDALRGDPRFAAVLKRVGLTLP
jgi:tetratricopeptide (TPR) repeat protein